MASTPEMLRIIRHAADKLDAQDPGANAKVIANAVLIDGVRNGAVERARSEAAAMAYASAVLRMVAACMDEEPTSAPAGLERGPDGRFRKVES